MIYYSLIILSLFILLQFILYKGSKKLYEEKLSKSRVLKSHNRIRSIFINFSVAFIVIFISYFTDDTTKNNFLSNFNSNIGILLIVFLVLLVVFPIITSYYDVKEKRIRKELLKRNIIEEYLICFLSVGFIYAFIVQTIPALILAVFICIITIIGLLSQK